MSLTPGIFAKTFPRPSLDPTLDAVVAHGLTHVQFNLSCAGLPTLPANVDDVPVSDIARAFANRGLIMSAVSGTFNMIDPDARARASGLLGLRRLLHVCRALGTSMVTLCTGTRSPLGMWTPHPENQTPAAWDDLNTSLRTILPDAEAQGITLAIEPEVANVVDSARKARRLLDGLGSPNLKIVIDPANLFHTGDLPRMREVLDEAFDLLGRDIVLAHAKDLTRDGAAGHDAAGTGWLDYDHYLRRLRGCGYHGALVLHGLREDQVATSLAFLRGKLDSTPGV